MFLELQGAAQARELRRVDIWEAEWLRRAHVKGAPLEMVPLKKFAAPRQRSLRQSPEVLQAMCDALAHAWGAEVVVQ